jgi:hypothetical protein
MKVRNDFYCVIQKDGAFCVWSVGNTRNDSWRAFKQGLLRLKPLNVQTARKIAQSEGCRCVKVKLMLA